MASCGCAPPCPNPEHTGGGSFRGLPLLEPQQDENGRREEMDKRMRGGRRERTKGTYARLVGGWDERVESISDACNATHDAMHDDSTFAILSFGRPLHSRAGGEGRRGGRGGPALVVVLQGQPSLQRRCRATRRCCATTDVEGVILTTCKDKPRVSSPSKIASRVSFNRPSTP